MSYTNPSLPGLDSSDPLIAAALTILQSSPPSYQEEPNHHTGNTLLLDPFAPLQAFAPPRPSFPNRPVVSRRRNLSERELFFVFVKILFRVLEKTGNMQLRAQAKAIVQECTKVHRMGLMGNISLQELVETRLRRTVGELYWSRSKHLFNRFCRKELLKTMAAV